MFMTLNIAAPPVPKAAMVRAKLIHGAGEANGGRLVHLPQLDSMRGLACLMVLVAHLQAVRGLGWLPEKIGVAGVGLFFVLSGFLITRILVADRESGRGLNAFYNRRVARIFPAY